MHALCCVFASEGSSLTKHQREPVINFFAFARYGGWAAKGLRVTWNCPVFAHFCPANFGPPFPDLLYLEAGITWMSGGSKYLSGCQGVFSHGPLDQHSNE